MRVLRVAAGLAARTGGPARFVVGSSIALAQPGVETVVWTTDLDGPASASSRHPARAADLPERVSQIELRVFRARPPRRLGWSPELRHALRSELEGFDVVHVHSLFLYPQLAAGLAAQRAGIPYVISPHGSLDPWLRRRGRLRKAVVDRVAQAKVLAGAAALHVTTAEEGRLLADVAPHVRRALVPAGIWLDDYADPPGGAEFRAQRLGGHTGPIVLNHGRIAAKKGLDILVRAFARVHAARPDALLVLVGPDDERLVAGLRTLAVAEGVRDAVVFVGMLRGRDKLAALAAADVWALPSHTENFGLAVVEAVAAGLPVILSPAVNVAAELEREGAALVRAATADDFAEAMLELLGDDERRAAVAAAGRKTAPRYDWNALGPDLAALYAQIAHG